MQCHEFDERMHELLDARRLPEQDAAMLAHAGECGSCRQQLTAQESLFRGLGARRIAAVSPGFSSRVVAQVHTAEVRPAFKPRRPWFLAASVVSTAAAALLAVGIFVNRRGPDVPPNGLVRQTPDASPHQPETGTIAVDPRTNSSKSPVPNALAHTQRNVPSAELVPLEQALQSLASQVPQAVKRLDEVEEATPGLRPVRTSFTLAIGTIRRTMPQQARPRPPKSSPRPNKRDSSWVFSEECEPA